MIMDRVESYMERAETLQKFISKKKGYDSGGHDDGRNGMSELESRRMHEQLESRLAKLHQ